MRKCMFVQDPDQLHDSLPLPYRWLVSLVSEILADVDHHIDHVSGLEKLQDRERGLKTHAESLVLDAPRSIAAVAGFTGPDQICDESVQYLKAATPSFFFNKDAPAEFKSAMKFPTFTVAATARSLALFDEEARICSDVWKSDAEISDIHVFGIQGAVAVAVLAGSDVQLLLVDLPTPRFSDAKIADMWKADRERVLPWNPSQPEISKFRAHANFAASVFAFDHVANTMWFSPADRKFLYALELDVSFEPCEEHQVLRRTRVSEKFPTFAFSVDPLEITALAASDYQVLIGCQSGAVALMRRGTLVPMRVLVGHYDRVEAVAIFSDLNKAATISADAYLHLYNLASGEILLRCASAFPAPSPGSCQGVGRVGNFFFYRTSGGYRVVDLDANKKISGFVSKTPLVAIDGNIFETSEVGLRRVRAVGNLKLSDPPRRAESKSPEIPGVPAWVDLDWSGIPAHARVSVAGIVAQAASRWQALEDARKTQASAAKAVEAAKLRKQELAN